MKSVYLSLVKWPFSHLIVFIWHRLYSVNPDHFLLQSLSNSEAGAWNEEVEWWWCPLENGAFSSFNDREKKRERKSTRNWIKAIKKSLREKSIGSAIHFAAGHRDWVVGIGFETMRILFSHSIVWPLPRFHSSITSSWQVLSCVEAFITVHISRTPQHLLFLLFHWNAFVAEHMEITVTRTQWYIHIEKWKGALTNMKTLLKRKNMKNNNNNSSSSMKQESSTHKQKMRTVNCVYFWCQRVTGWFRGTFT